MADRTLPDAAFEDVQLFRKGESPTDPVPSVTRSPAPSSSLHAGLEDKQRRVEQFLYYQSELLDTKAWQSYIDLFSEDGNYWMPVSASQTDWLDNPSIIIEDRNLMRVRMNRLLHPNAWSLSGIWETSHAVSNVVIETEDNGELVVRSRFHMFEQRRNMARQFAGSYRHTLVELGGSFKIKLQRVDLVNSQAPFDYVIQAWI